MRKFICIVCPKGCHLEVDDQLKVTGNSCKRGETYGISEATNPVRMVTSTVKIKSELITRLPVRTDQPIPKSRIFERSVFCCLFKDFRLRLLLSRISYCLSIGLHQIS